MVTIIQNSWIVPMMKTNWTNTFFRQILCAHFKPERKKIFEQQNLTRKKWRKNK